MQAATREIKIAVPETVFRAEKQTEIDFAKELCTMAAVKLYELGRLSSGVAAQLAGLSRIEFLLSLPKYQVFPFATELLELEDSKRESD